MKLGFRSPSDEEDSYLPNSGQSQEDGFNSEVGDVLYLRFGNETLGSVLFSFAIVDLFLEIKFTCNQTQDL